MAVYERSFGHAEWLKALLVPELGGLALANDSVQFRLGIELDIDPTENYEEAWPTLSLIRTEQVPMLIEFNDALPPQEFPPGAVDIKSFLDAGQGLALAHGCAIATLLMEMKVPPTLAIHLENEISVVFILTIGTFGTISVKLIEEVAPFLIPASKAIEAA